ncbi:MAG: nucleotidyltransferase family protein [Deltaproteobacteria bacterium]|nr:nucleotidyltransferase family protein [Deltaproteobacteria bacterium]
MKTGLEQGTDLAISAAETLLRSALRGEPAQWPQESDPTFEKDLLKASAYHGVQALIYHHLKPTPFWSTWPTVLRDRLEKAAHRQAATELIRRHELVTVLGELANSGVRSLLLKGTPLAYALYPSAALRTRGDTDLLIKTADLGAVCEVLERLGYRRPNAVSGKLISSQFCYQKQDRYDVGHDLDVHWRISNFQSLGHVLTFDELDSRSVPVPALGPYARRLGFLDALLLACIHRLTHYQAPYYIGPVAHYGGNRLIWLYDIHLLASSLPPEDWELFIRAAEEKRLRAICLDGLSVAAQALGTCLPKKALQALVVEPRSEDISVAPFSGRHWRWQISELLALPDWRQRMTLMREHLFPPASYMLQKYRKTDRRLLPFLYLRRAVNGFLKRLGP